MIQYGNTSLETLIYEINSDFVVDLSIKPAVSKYIAEVSVTAPVAKILDFL